MKIIAVHNIKGGVGKTTTSVNMSWVIAQVGWRVLLWDLDPQGAASYYFRIKNSVKGGGKSLLKKHSVLIEHVKETDFEGLDLLPADFSYRNLDLYLDKREAHRDHLKQLLEPLGDVYDYIVLDCPPSFSLLSENVYASADAIMVPTIPTALSLRTLNQLSDYCREIGMDESKLKPFFSMVNADNPNHQLIVEKCPPRRQTVLPTKIPFTLNIERMSLKRQPVGAVYPKGDETAAYTALWSEVSESLY